MVNSEVQSKLVKKKIFYDIELKQASRVSNMIKVIAITKVGWI